MISSTRRIAAERDKAAAEAARLAAEAQAQQARAAAEQAKHQQAALRDQLRQQLNQVLETRETAQRLSENRAESVRTYLVSQGIASTAVATRGFGDTQTVASNDTATGRQQNRRVELIVAGESIGTSALTARRDTP